MPKAEPPGLTMRKKHRLHGRRDFQTVYNEGHTWANELLVLKMLANGLPHNRFGFAVGKRLGKAVVRNKLRRRLREAVRKMPLREGHDVIIVARKPAVEASYSQLEMAATNLLRRAGMIEAEQPVERKP